MKFSCRHGGLEHPYRGQWGKAALARRLGGGGGRCATSLGWAGGGRVVLLLGSFNKAYLSTSVHPLIGRKIIPPNCIRISTSQRRVLPLSREGGWGGGVGCFGWGTVVLAPAAGTIRMEELMRDEIFDREFQQGRDALNERHQAGHASARPPPPASLPLATSSRARGAKRQPKLRQPWVKRALRPRQTACHRKSAARTATAELRLVALLRYSSMRGPNP